MTPDPPAVTPPPTEVRPERVVSSRPGDWSELSRWMLRRTIDLIVIGLVLLAGLTVARRVLVWWKTEPGDLVADHQAAFAGDALAPWGIGPGGARLEFGTTGLSLRRVVLRGTLAEAQEQLQTIARETARDWGSQPRLRLSEALGPRERREMQLLTRLTAVEPVERDPDGRWSLYRIEGPLEMVVAVAPDQPDAEEARVVCWGVALPVDTGTWRLLMVTPRAESTGVSASPALPLPPNCRRELSLSDAVGGGLTTFSGPGPAETWQVHFDNVAESLGWKPVRRWSERSSGRSAVWIAPGGGEPRRIDVQLTRGEKGWAGVVSFSPLSSQDQP